MATTLLQRNATSAQPLARNVTHRTSALAAKRTTSSRRVSVLTNAQMATSLAMVFARNVSLVVLPAQAQLTTNAQPATPTSTLSRERA
jgi:hypothetical protein